MPRIVCPDIVGRVADRAQLEARIQDATRGVGSMTVVLGPPGIGKSRLASAAITAAGSAGVVVRQGRCVPAAVATPYRALAEAIVAGGDMQTLLVRSELGGFAGALQSVLAGGDGAAQESAVVAAEAVLRALSSLAPDGALLVLEDLHWADPETLAAVEYFAEHAARVPIAMVCTMRDESSSDALALALRLESRRAADVLSLQPLSSQQMRDMAARILSLTAVPGEIARLLDESAEGNPLLVEELLAGAVSQGALVLGPDGWTVATPIQRFVPRTFATSVRSRFNSLAPSGRALVGTAALLGRHFDWRTAVAAAGLDTAEAASLLEAAVALQLLTPWASGYSFRHALTRDAVLDSLLPHERSHMAERCLQVIASSVSPSDGSAEMAAHLAEIAGDHERAAELLLLTADASLRRGALTSAAAALQRAAALPAAPATRMLVLDRLLTAQEHAGDLKAARATAGTVLALQSDAGSPPALRADVRIRLAACAVAATQFDVAHDELNQARACCPQGGDALLDARIGVVAAQLAMREMQPADAEALAADAVSAAERAARPDIVCQGLEVLARCARLRDLDESARAAQRMLDVAEGADLALWRTRARYQLGVAEMFDSGEVETLWRAREEALAAGSVAWATSLAVELAAGLEAQDRLAEARAVVDEGLQLAELLDLPVLRALFVGFIVIIEAHSGDRARADSAFQRFLSLGDVDTEIVAAVIGDGCAVAALVDEDRALARELLQRAASMFPEGLAITPRLPIALLALVDAAEGREPDFSRINGVTPMNGQAAGYLGHARAVIAGRSGQIDAANAAASAADRRLTRLPWYRHLVHRIVAEAAFRDGWGQPVAWLSEASAYFTAAGHDRLASACTAMLRRAGLRIERQTAARRNLPPALQAAGVTPREAEVLQLIGEGLMNRDIGERLFLSERTVEQHVAALKRKLQLGSRAQLAVYAERLRGAPFPPGR